MRVCVCARAYVRACVKQALFDDPNVSFVCVDVCECMFAFYVHVRARVFVCMLQGLVDDPDISSGKWSEIVLIYRFFSWKVGVNQYQFDMTWFMV